MLDGRMRGLLDAPLNWGGRRLAGLRVSADAITLAGLCLSLASAAGVALGLSATAVAALLLAGRLADGLDGAVARVKGKSDFGGYLDIVCDFAFYGAIPLAFVLRDPTVNGAAGAFLLASFYLNGATFLGFAILAAKQGLENHSRGEKSLYFTAGLMEGTETILFFLAMVAWPGLFPTLAWAFGGLCLVTAIARIFLARRMFSTAHDLPEAYDQKPIDPPLHPPRRTTKTLARNWRYFGRN